MPLLHWLTRDNDLKLSSKAPYRLLEHVPELSFGDSDSENMLIQGDNLDALKALLPFFAGRVKCIYADPPFNTGQAFSDYDDNIEHSLWLSMMYPSLELQRDLLTDDGTLFIHIDDNEIGYLIAIADEVMGRRNRISIVTFKQGAPTGHKAINPGMVSTTNFLLVYSKNKAAWKPNRIFTGRERDKRYARFLVNPHENHAKWKFTTLAVAVSNATGKKVAVLKKELGDGYEEYLNEFVIKHANQVCRTARPEYGDVGEDVKRVIDASLASPREIMLLERKANPEMYFLGGERIIFYTSKLKEVDGVLVAGEPLTTLWADLLSNNLHKEGGVELPKSKKPEALIKRCFELATKEGDLVLDCYLGSGTTAAVAHKMRRQWVGIERGEHSRSKCLPRLKSVVEGEQSGISKAQRWQGGGGFRFYRLGAAAFDADGRINPGIRFLHLAAHVWFSETHLPFPKTPKTPLLGIYKGVAYYLLYNGILGDKRPDSGNVLTSKVLAALPAFDGPKVIYGESSRFGSERLQLERITFKQTPYDIKAR